MKITHVKAQEILNSCGTPTSLCTLTLENGVCVRASIPSGRSKSKYAALEKRDGYENWYNGMGVSSCVELIEQLLASHVVGRDPDVHALDEKLIGLDGTPDKQKF